MAAPDTYLDVQIDAAQNQMILLQYELQNTKKQKGVKYDRPYKRNDCIEGGD